MLAISELLSWPPTEFPIRPHTELQTPATDCLSSGYLTLHDSGKDSGEWFCEPAFPLRMTQFQVP